MLTGTTRSALALALFLSTSPALAATITVNSNTDTPDGVPGNGTCGTGLPGNSCSLRAAIQEANANGSTSNTIEIGNSGTVSLLSDLPEVTKPVLINGPAGGYTISANGNSALRFACPAEPATCNNGTFAVSNLIIDGASTSSSDGGGGIYFGVAATVALSLNKVSVTGSEATAGGGGGIAINLLTQGSTALLDGVTLTGNTASGNGGGLLVRHGAATVANPLLSAVEIEDSIITGNSAAAGGGIAVRRGRLNVFGTTISGNDANSSGGGIYLDVETWGGSLRIENSTLSANVAATGGGIGTAAANPSASFVTFTTITGNTASTAGMGGGLLGATNPLVTFPGNLSNPFTGNVVANNTGGNCAAALAHSDGDNSGYNLTEGTSCGFNQASDRVAATVADLKLGGLANNPTAPATHALQAGSPAIDAGNPGWDPGNDQRGADTQDGGADGTPGDGNAVRDIGAYEFGGFGLVQFNFPAAAANFDVVESAGPALVLIKRYGTGSAATTTPTVVFTSSTFAGTDPATQGTCGSGGADYTALASNPGNFVFAATGATQVQQTASLAICNDDVAENNEKFAIALSEPGTDGVGYDLGARATGTVTIVESENGTFQFNPLTSSGNEGTAAAPGSATVTITRTVGTKGAVRVSYATSSTCTPACTASVGADYTAATAFVDFADGDTSKTVTLNFAGDAAFEADETFQVSLTGVACQNLAAGASCDARLVGNASDANRIARVTITNDDVAKPGALQFSAATYDALEADGSLTVTVKRVGGTDGAVTVTYGATDGTATSGGLGGDYSLDPFAAHELTWANGDAADKTFEVTLTDDFNVESNKGFTLTLSAPTGGAGGQVPTVGTPGSAAVTLISDEQPAFQITIPAGGIRALESSGSVTIAVSQDAFTGPDVTVPYWTVDSTATSGIDFTGVPQATPNTLTFTGGGSGKTIMLTLAADASAEGNEAFQLQLGDPVGGGQVAGTNPATVTIVDPPAARFTASSYTRASEAGGGSITVTVQRTGDTADAFSVDFAISECATAGCAGESVDYTRASGFTGTLSWAAGDAANKTFTFNVLADTLVEGDETVALALSNPRTGLAPGAPATLGTPNTATGVIPDDDYRFEFVEASPLAVGEAAGNAVVTVRRFGSTLGAASVSFATADGTAVAGADYTSTASPPALSWAAGEGGTKTITVPVLDSAVDELDETFTIALSGASANVSAEATAISGSPFTVQVTDDDAASYSIDDVTVSEGNSGTTTATFTVSRSPADHATSVDFATAGGTAGSGADFAAASGTLNFAASATPSTQTISVQVTGDTTDETDETYTVGLSAASAGTAIGDASGAGTITDDDAPPSLSIADLGVTEGNTSDVTAQFVVTLSAASGKTVTVNYATSNGTATAPADYTAVAAGTVTFAPGETSKVAAVTVRSDALDELAETFSVALSNGVNASILDGSALGTIQDGADDLAPTVTLAAAPATIAEGGGVATFTATLSAASGQVVTVNLGFTGTATNPADYTRSGTAITIAAGATSGSVTVTAVQDAADEADETVIVDITAVTNGTESGTQQRTATITDDDVPPPSDGGGGSWSLLSLWLLIPAWLRRRTAFAR